MVALISTDQTCLSLAGIDLLTINSQRIIEVELNVETEHKAKVILSTKVKHT